MFSTFIIFCKLELFCLTYSFSYSYFSQRIILHYYFLIFFNIQNVPSMARGISFKLILPFPCLSPGINHFSKLLWLLLGGMIFRFQHLGALCLLPLVSLLPGPSADKSKKYTYVYTIPTPTHLYLPSHPCCSPQYLQSQSSSAQPHWACHTC